MLPKILEMAQDENHVVFTRGYYNLNIIGLRSKNEEANSFDDKMFVVFKVPGDTWVELCFKVTTDPGKYWLNNPMRVSGSAILCPGQYRGVYKIDGHGKTKYEALCQRNGKVRVYRDSNKDEILDHDPDSIEEGYFGINIHRASSKRESSAVEKWSAGCQVFADPSDFELFMALCRISSKKYGNSFTYTLLEEK